MSLIDLEFRQGDQIAVITLNRAEVHHAINEEMMSLLENILDQNYRKFASGISAPGRNVIAALRFTF